PFRRLSHEPDLYFAGPLGIRFDLPSRIDVPADHDAMRGFVGKHACPAAFAAVLPAIVHVSADPWLEYGLGNGHREEVVLSRLDAVELLDEDAERSLQGRGDDDLQPHGDDDLQPHGRFFCIGGHQVSSGGGSMISLY